VKEIERHRTDESDDESEGDPTIALRGREESSRETTPCDSLFIEFVAEVKEANNVPVSCRSAPSGQTKWAFH
jgi:hypothetical protein